MYIILGKIIPAARQQSNNITVNKEYLKVPDIIITRKKKAVCHSVCDTNSLPPGGMPACLACQVCSEMVRITMDAASIILKMGYLYRLKKSFGSR